MPEKALHIVSFDIPYPPNYGGVIDVYYTIKELHRMGIKVHLHCFEYPGRDRKKELEEVCESVIYYPRLLGLKYALSYKPYIVNSRKSDDLLQNLLKRPCPVMFEGLHSCFYLAHPALKNRFKIYRESNIEHHYYFHLFLSDKRLTRKLYYLAASLKLYMYQRILKHAGLMIVVSKKDTDYLRKNFPGIRVEYLPSFHGNNKVECLTGSGDYVLYHGNLEIPENERAAIFLIRKVFSGSDIPFTVAGMKPTRRLAKICRAYNVRLIENPGSAEMDELIRQAHLNLLYTFQDTGLKLKLINALYKGRHCVSNSKMLNGSDLDHLCHISDTVAGLKNTVKQLMKSPFTEDMLTYRRRELKKRSEQKNAERLIQLIFPGD
ncbi:MAG: glycosyltransferase [Bacteroidales bacterium]|nr:glycosyltransferase [Bacteroidales bacterium]